MRSSHTANIPQVNSYLVFTTQWCQDFRPAAVWPHCIYLSALRTEDWQVLGARSNSVITAFQDHRLAECSHWTTVSILVSWSATVLLFGRVVRTEFQCLSFLASYHLLLDFPKLSLHVHLHWRTGSIHVYILLTAWKSCNLLHCLQCNGSANK